MDSSDEGLIYKHVKSLDLIRKELLPMDDIVMPVMGISDWDDSVCISFGTERLLASSDGPYEKRLVMRSALIHAATDILAKGGKPLFALDTLIGSTSDVTDMLGSLKEQALALSIPLLGGNTKFEADVAPMASITVIGKLVTEEPIRDRGAKKEDIVALIGEPLWGSRTERIQKAKKLFSTWSEVIQNVRINAAKDVTKGGLVCALYEMSEKSGRLMSLDRKIPFSMTRNLDNFLVSVCPEEYCVLEGLCEKNDVGLFRIGRFR